MQIRPFRSDDADALAALFEEMQSHYGVPCPSRATIVGDLQDLPLGVGILVAEGDRLVGLAAFARIYPGPGLRKGLFLKELFVSASARGQGAGRALLGHLAALAVREGYGRIDWTGSRDEPALMRFYESTGAVPCDDKRFFRLAGAALSGLATPGCG